MQENRTALIAGATGLIGKSCLQYLLSDNYYSKVIVVSRKAISFSHPKMKEHLIDFDNLQNHKHLLVAHHVFCCLGTTLKKAGSKAKFRKVDLEYPAELAKITHENGAVQFNIVTALGADIKSNIFYNKTKGEVEEFLKTIGFKSLNIFRPSILTGQRSENRPREKTGIKLMQALRFFLVGPLFKYRPVHADKVAKAMVINAKREPEGVNIFESDKIQEIA
jgi:uncharacterized protein YbjT (DUF2867 family)